MKTYTLNEFFEKMDWEGGPEGMAGYTGDVQITDNLDLNIAWAQFVSSLQDIQDLYDDWSMSRPPEEDEE